MEINPKDAFNNIADKSMKLAADLSSAAKETADKATDSAKAIADDVVVHASEFNEQTQQMLAETKRDIDLRLYKPIFPETLSDSEFAKPRMIVIVDENDRKNIEVCKGAVGWIAKAGGMRVLNLYNSAVPDSQFVFHPYPVLDATYYEDPHEPSKYVNLSSFFSTMQQEQMAELQSIALSLGAKHCKLTSYEVKNRILSRRGDLGKQLRYEGASIKQETSTDYRKENLAENKVEFDVWFEGSDEPVEPNLKWYANDRVILDLIRSRIEGVNPLKEYNLNLEYKTSEIMSIKAATKVDAALKQLSITTTFKCATEVESESRRKLSLHIEF